MNTVTLLSRTVSRGKPLFGRLMLAIAIDGCLVVSHSAQGSDVAALAGLPYASTTETTSRHILARSPSAAFSPPTVTPIKSVRRTEELVSHQETDGDRGVDDALEAMHAYPTTRGMLLILPKLLFRSAGSQLSPVTSSELEPLARFMIEFPDRRVEIDGFTDGVGDILSNQLLSQRRAETVKSTLVSLGVTAARIRAYGVGERACVASNTNAAGRRLNRRVEIIISNKRGAIFDWSDL